VTCSATQYESSEETPTADRVCSDHAVCTDPTDDHAADEFASTAAGTHNNRVCSALTTCDYATEYMSAAPGSHADRVCTKFAKCTSTEWEDVQETKTSNRHCKAHTVCLGHEYETRAATARSNVKHHGEGAVGLEAVRLRRPAAARAHRGVQVPRRGRAVRLVVGGRVGAVRR